VSTVRVVAFALALAAASGSAGALDLVATRPPVEIPDGRVTIGARTLVLPPGPGQWFYVDHQERPVAGGPRNLQTSTDDRAFLVRIDRGSLALAAEVYLLRADLLKTGWDDLPCAGRQDIYLKEHLAAPSLRDCVAVRGLRSADVQAFVAANVPAGPAWLARRKVALPEFAANIRYARFSSNTYGVIDVFVPATHFASDQAAIDWAESLRSALKPVFEHRVDLAAVPALPPASPPASSAPPRAARPRTSSPAPGSRPPAGPG